MSSTTKVVLSIVGIVFGLWFLAKVIFPFLLNMVLSIVVPLAIVFGVGYLLYCMVGRKALTSSRRRLLP